MIEPLRRLGGRLRGASPAAVLGAAWAFLLLYAFPGQMTTDSLDHLREARLHVYSDSHPPVINLLFRVCDFVVAGPFGMLVVQSLLLLCGLYAIVRRELPARRAAWLAAAVFVAPPVMPVMAAIWKDCMMAGLLAVGFAGLCSPRRARNLWALAALTGATAMRYNAFGATLPMIVLLFEAWPGLPAVRRYGLAAAAWLATTVAAFGINSALTDKPMYYWQSSLAVFDIVGTYVHVDGVLPDAQLQAELAGTELLVEHDIHATMHELYSPKQFFPILGDPAHHLWSLPIYGLVPAPQAQRDAITRAFWHVVTTHPWAYVQHRLAATAAVLAIGQLRMPGAINKRAPKNEAFQAEFGISTRASYLQLRLNRLYYVLLEYTPLSAPWLYLLGSLALVPLGFRQRDTLALLLSGLVMEATLLLLAHSVDYRYSHWLVISTLVSAALIVVRRRRTAAPDRAHAALAEPAAPAAPAEPAAPAAPA